MKSPRVACYVRVSTREQNFRQQETPLRDYCRRQGFRSVVWFREKRSGFDSGREQMAELMARARAGEFDLVCVHKLDRWGRSLVHSLQSILELRTRRVGFISVTEGVDTREDSPAGNLTLAILSAVASFTGDQIRERASEGRAAAKKRGVRFGRPMKNADKLEKARKLRAQGQSLREIGRALHLSAGYLSRALKTEAAL